MADARGAGSEGLPCDGDVERRVVVVASWGSVDCFLGRGRADDDDEDEDDEEDWIGRMREI